MEKASSSRALVRADWLRADWCTSHCWAASYRTDANPRLVGQVRLPSSVAIPENKAFSFSTRSKSAPSHRALLPTVESMCSESCCTGCFLVRLTPNTKQRTSIFTSYPARYREERENCGNPGNGLVLDPARRLRPGRTGAGLLPVKTNAGHSFKN